MSQISVQEQLVILKKYFNNYSLFLASHLCNVAPKSCFKIYKPFIEKLVNDNSNVMIEGFILNVLKYENEINNEDESFFLGKKYDDVTGNDSSNVNKVFEFKSIWFSLEDSDKSLIKSYMKLLCQIARKYFDLIYQ